MHGFPVLVIITFEARSALKGVFPSSNFHIKFHPFTFLAVVLAGLALSSFFIVGKPLLALCTKDSIFISVTELAIINFLRTIQASVLGRVQFKLASTGLAENISIIVSITLYTAWNLGLAIDTKSSVSTQLKSIFATISFANHSVLFKIFTVIVTFQASLNEFSTGNAPVLFRVEAQRVFTFCTERLGLGLSLHFSSVAFSTIRELGTVST